MLFCGKSRAFLEKFLVIFWLHCAFWLLAPSSGSLGGSLVALPWLNGGFIVPPLWLSLVASWWLPGGFLVALGGSLVVPCGSLCLPCACLVVLRCASLVAPSCRSSPRGSIVALLWLLLASLVASAWLPHAFLVAPLWLPGAFLVPCAPLCLPHGSLVAFSCGPSVRNMGRNTRAC